MKHEIIYLDVCTLCRPFDNQKMLRIQLETNSYYLIMQAIRNQRFTMATSPVHSVEIDAISNIIEKTELFQILSQYGEKIIGDKDKIKKRGEWLNNVGMGLADAMHLAFAEIKADYFITCDDKLIKKSKKIGVNVEVMTPVEFCVKENLK